MRDVEADGELLLIVVDVGEAGSQILGIAQIAATHGAHVVRCQRHRMMTHQRRMVTAHDRLAEELKNCHQIYHFDRYEMKYCKIAR